MTTDEHSPDLPGRVDAEDILRQALDSVEGATESLRTGLFAELSKSGTGRHTRIREAIEEASDG